MTNLSAKERNATIPYCFEGEIEHLQELARELPKLASVCILGAGPGIMALALFEGNPYLVIHAIDNNARTLDTFNKHLEDVPYQGTLFVYCRNTSDVCEYFDKGKFDLIIVDADHSYDAVQEDLDNYWPKLKIGGRIFLHDYIDIEHTGNNGVKKAFEEFTKDHWDQIDDIKPVGISMDCRRCK